MDEEFIGVNLKLNLKEMSLKKEMSDERNVTYKASNSLLSVTSDETHGTKKMSTAHSVSLPQCY